MLLRRRTLLWPLDVGPGPDLAVRPRSDWTDVLPAGDLEAEEVRFLLVHHTAGSTEHAAEEVPALLNGIRRFHVENRGWPDIAYNFLIDRYGTVWEGRASSLERPVRGDASGGNQGYSQLVCLIGDFTEELPTDAALGSLVLTLAWLAERYAIDLAPGSEVSFVSRGSNRWPEGTEVTTPPLAGHRDMSHTACPGDAFYPLLASAVLPRVREAAAPATTASTQPATTTSTIAPRGTVPPSATTSSAPSTSAPVAAPVDGHDGLSPVGWSLAGVGVGLLGGLLGWRIRRMRHEQE